jgi:hypothetical protein
MYPQMGGCGCGQMGYMGDLFTDVKNAIVGGFRKTVTGVETQAELSFKQLLMSVAGYPEALKKEAINNFFNTPTGQQLVEESKDAWLQEWYNKNRTSVNMGVIVVAGLLGFLLINRLMR